MTERFHLPKSKPIGIVKDAVQNETQLSRNGLRERSYSHQQGSRKKKEMLEFFGGVCEIQIRRQGTGGPGKTL